MSAEHSKTVADIVSLEIAELDAMLKAFEGARSEDDLSPDLISQAAAMMAAGQERSRRVNEITERLCADLVEKVRMAVETMVLADQGTPDKIEYKIKLTSPDGNWVSVR